MAKFRLETARLVLRPWREEDIDDLCNIQSDPEVMATLGPVMDRREVAASIKRMQAIEAAHGFTFWAMERREDRRVIGCCGVKNGAVGPIVGEPEIGWRMARDCWGNGYVTEGATATLEWLFAHRANNAAYAITNTENHRSRAVMERLGMRYQPGQDFDHPDLAENDPLLRHVTYRIGRKEWTTR
jgi:RimJ/RimL family protein N-acetyltransferase